MSKAEGQNAVKRFFIQGTNALHKELQHLAIDLETSAEKLAGELLVEAVARKKAELADKQKSRGK